MDQKEQLDTEFKPMLITIDKIEWDQKARMISADDARIRPGDHVAIRPCSEADGTCLGIYVGDLTFIVKASIENGVLRVAPYPYSNPCFWVPKLNRYVMGRESWWRRIESKNDFATITDEDINSVWYVKALKSLAEQEVA